MNTGANLNEAPLVSVIIPAYNYGAYVAEAVQSALDQDYRPIEVIVCDDGSTDNTLEVLRSFGDAIQVIQGKHGGVSAARNSAIEASRGEFLAFLDADDCWFPTKIREQVEALKINPAAAVCHTGCELFDGVQVDGPIEASRREAIQGRCFDKLFYANGIVLSSAMVRRSAMPSEGFDHDLAGPEDYALFLKVLFNAEAVYLPRTLTRYRRHRTQTTVDGARKIQVQVGIARLRVLKRYAPQISSDQHAAMRQFALKELETCSYSRYWQHDWKSALRGFGALRDQGVSIPMRHFLKAWALTRLCSQK